MSAPFEAWMKSGEYMPPILRDFHDQKDLFKTIHDTTAVEKHVYARDISWRDGHCYVIDIFLWWMARRGYTLQRSRRRYDFRDLDADMSAAKKRRDEQSARALGLTPLPAPGGSA